MSIEQLSGSEIDGWRLESVLGKGADGIVYRAEKDGAVAAVKLFFPENLAKSAWSGARERLELQLALVGQKHHENLVEIYGGGELEELGTLFLVMELVPGKSLDKLIGTIPTTAVPLLIRQLADAAQHLEVMELVHRDIKPANIVISDDFKHLTLLDLGVVHHLPSDDDNGRLSGMEFVATTRYSPPEFVWRTEENDADGAWRAVTFYQIGATLHDMIMGKPIFSGFDTPRACLYDSVRDRTPILEPVEVASWVVLVAEACLLKDWRQRLRFVSWDSFSEPVSVADREQQERRIRLRQLRNMEMREANRKQTSKIGGPTREQQLWYLNNTLILELRTYLKDALIYPRCSVSESCISPTHYETRIAFESDESHGFPQGLIFTIGLSVEPDIEEATHLSFGVTVDGQVITSATWVEMFNVDTARATCQQSFVDAVELITTTGGH